MSRILARNRALFQKASSAQAIGLMPPNTVFFTTTTVHRDEALSATLKASPEDGTPGKAKGIFRYTAGNLSAARRKLSSGNKRSNHAPRKAKGDFDVTPSALDAQVPDKETDVLDLLYKPTWSVRSLLPPKSPTQTITRTQLHHLLRLSALPLPKDKAEEKKMLQSLHAQLHFVGDIQGVNTDGVEPLVRIAEETEAGRKEATIGLEDLREALDKEIVTGRNKRSRRVRDGVNMGEGEDWDVFKTASETVDVPGSGRYFVVRGGKEKEKE